MATKPPHQDSYQPNKKKIGELLALTSPSLSVPDWQRSYSWQKSHIETFWSDITLFWERIGSNSTSEYFLGTLVLVNGQDERLLVLDGQQRLATSTILLSCIRDRLKLFNADAAKQTQDKYLVGYDFETESTIHKLRLNIYDRDFFKRLVLDKRETDYQEPTPELASHHLIKSAREILTQKLAETCKGLEEKAAFDAVLRIQRLLTNQFSVIAVSSDDEDSAAEVFETLNDRGMGLSTPDLLRNLVIRRAIEGDQDQIVECWKDVISFDTDNKIKAFLRHYWISKYGDVKSQSLYRQIKQEIISKEINSLALSQELDDAANLYRSIQKAETDSDELSSLLADIQSLGAGAAILMPPLLSIFQQLEDDADKIRATIVLSNVFVRDGIIGQIENSALENSFYRAARDLRDHSNVNSFIDILLETALIDEEVQTRFRRLSLSHNGSRRYILYKIELYKRNTEELDVNPPSKVHVEHIYPQNPTAEERWPYHSRLINRLGNLSLLSKRINTTIKNGNFALKRPHFAESEIMITKELAALDKWDSDAVDTRQASFAELVAEIWPLN